MTKKSAGTEDIKWYRDRKFWAGFFGWWIVNGLLYFLLLFIQSELYTTFSCLIFIGNIVALVALSRSPKYKRVATGILGAFAAAFALTLLAAILLFVYCFVYPGINY
jgi:hypothetical protein